MTEDQLALEIMDDDGFGCAPTSSPAERHIVNVLRASIGRPLYSAAELAALDRESQALLVGASPTEFEQGYMDMAGWLERQAPTVSLAEHALSQRHASLQLNDYNLGGNQAAADYIARMRRAA